MCFSSIKHRLHWRPKVFSLGLLESLRKWLRVAHSTLLSHTSIFLKNSPSFPNPPYIHFYFGSWRSRSIKKQLASLAILFFELFTWRCKGAETPFVIFIQIHKLVRSFGWASSEISKKSVLMKFLFTKMFFRALSPTCQVRKGVSGYAPEHKLHFQRFIIRPTLCIYIQHTMHMHTRYNACTLIMHVDEWRQFDCNCDYL